MKRLTEAVSLLPGQPLASGEAAILATVLAPPRDDEVDERLRELGCSAPKRFIEHHHCHAATAYYASPYGDAPEQVLVVTVDGTGDGICHAFATVGADHQLVRQHESTIYQSIAEVYGYVTHNLGFRYNRHEGKITGLAAYGDSSKTIGVFRRAHGLRPGAARAALRLPWGRLGARKLRRLLAGHSREDVAAGVQRAIEEVMMGLVAAALRRYPRSILRRGRAVLQRPAQPGAARDPGCGRHVRPPRHGGHGAGPRRGARPLGASCASAPRRFRCATSISGQSFSDAEIEAELRARGLAYRRCTNVHAETAELLARKKIVARFAGRMEYGPRSLGHRSIFYDTSDKTVNDWLNKRLAAPSSCPSLRSC